MVVCYELTDLGGYFGAVPAHNQHLAYGPEREGRLRLALLLGIL